MELLQNKNYLIDTNILLYAINEDSAFNDTATTLLRDFQRGKYRGFVSTQNILEFKRVVTHDVFKKKINYAKINDLLEIWLGFLTVVYEDKTAWIEYKKLEGKYKPTGNMIFDAWIVATMIANNLDKIITVNHRDFVKFLEIKVIALN